MKNPNDGFIKGRIRSLRFALKGMFLLIKTEDSIKVQLFVAVLITGVGFYFDISNIEWMFQTTVIGLVLVAESLNTAVEKVSDFIHPDYHKKIGFIKDISAGAASFAAIISLIVAGFIYFPKIALLF
ncbi:MAG: diacylglycerol kinase family protein [Flavobacteriaceae bacterium]